MHARDALPGVLLRIRQDQLRVADQLAGLATEQSVEPGLYTLAQASTRLGASQDFLRDHATEYRVVRLTTGPKARLHFPIHFIEAVIENKAEPVRKLATGSRRRRRQRKQHVEPLPVK